MIYKRSLRLFRRIYKQSIQQLAPITSSTVHQHNKNTYLVDENNVSSTCITISNCNKFTTRTHNCGELRIHNIGEKVTLCGWLEYQRMSKFLIMRDGYGHTQLLINEKATNSECLLSKIPFESILEICGTVLSRPKNMVNKQDATGEIEVLVDSLKVLNKANSVLPFNVREFQKAKEALRMQYRYIDLRFMNMQRNMRVRSQVLNSMRNFLINDCHFVDVETPTLFNATPGGAQEFVVPTRFPGQVYSLVQSPQQFKQMLMAGAIDRYFQIARCYRDEGSKPDRQPEFTQLDIEMSFTTVNGVLTLIEELLQYSWPEFLQPLPHVFCRMTYDDALEQYGTDKPDLRADFKIQNFSHLMTDYDSAHVLVFQEPYDIALTKSVRENFQSLAGQQASNGLKFSAMKVLDSQSCATKLNYILGETVACRLADALNLARPSVVFFACGLHKFAVCWSIPEQCLQFILQLPLLGQVRLEYLHILEQLGHKIRKEGIQPVWITDFPLFEEDDVTKCLQSVHHPFTAPHPDDLPLLELTPLKVRSQAYDLVLNGNEIGGGSIRIHEPELQRKVLDMLQINTSGLQHMLDMLNSGCPPHGGIALGLDRLLATILQTPSIRDVIAFPKTFEGRDPISGAPSSITEKDKKLYHIEINTDKT